MTRSIPFCWVSCFLGPWVNADKANRHDSGWVHVVDLWQRPFDRVRFIEPSEAWVIISSWHIHGQRSFWGNWRGCSILIRFHLSTYGRITTDSSSHTLSREKFGDSERVQSLLQSSYTYILENDWKLNWLRGPCEVPAACRLKLVSWQAPSPNAIFQLDGEGMEIPKLFHEFNLSRTADKRTAFHKNVWICLNTYSTGFNLISWLLLQCITSTRNI